MKRSIGGRVALWTLALSSALSSLSWADVKLPNIFSDHMVLQQLQKIVFGALRTQANR